MKIKSLTAYFSYQILVIPKRLVRLACLAESVEDAKSNESNLMFELQASERMGGTKGGGG